MFRRYASLVVIGAPILLWLAIVGVDAQPAQPTTFVAGLVLDGSYYTDSWNNGHTRGFFGAIAALRAEGYTVESLLEQNVRSADVAATYARMKQESNANVIASPNFVHRAGFLEYVKTPEGASQYFITGASLGAPNNRSFSIYGSMFQGTYVAGRTCALKSKTGNVGIIALDVRGANSYVTAFAIGARRANPNVRVYMMQNRNSTGSAIVDARIARDFVQMYNVDCILGGSYPDGAYATIGNGNYPQVDVIGVFEDMRFKYGEHVLFSLVYDWTSLYLEGMRGYLTDTFPGGQVKWGSVGSTIALSVPSTRVSSALYEDIKQTMARIVNNTLCVFPWDIVKNVYYDAQAQAKALAATQLVWETGASEPTRCLTQLQAQNMPAILLADAYIINPYNYTIEETLVRLHVAESHAGAIALYVIVGLGIAVCIALAFLVARYRNNNLIRASSVEFMFVIILGCGLMYTSVFMYFGVPTLAMCQLRLWLFFPGLGMVTSALLFKNFRIWRIFSNKSMEVFSIGTRELFLYGVAPATAGQIVLLILWSALNTYRPIEDATSPLLAPDQRNMRCYSNSPWSLSLVLAYNALLVLGNVAIGVLVRKVPYDAYREFRHIMLATYNAAVWGLACLVVALAVSYTAETETFILTATIVVIATGYLAFVFAERIYAVAVLGRDAYASKSPGTSGRTTSNGLHGRSSEPIGTGRATSSSSTNAAYGSGDAGTASVLRGHARNAVTLTKMPPDTEEDDVGSSSDDSDDARV